MKYFTAVLIVLYIHIGTLIPLRSQGQNITEVTVADLLKITPQLDSIIKEVMDKRHVPGASFALVYKGSTIYTQGYGFQNLEKQIPIDPIHTLYDQGSVPKLLVATAILQLVEKGELDLHENINKYLTDVQFEPFDKPITIHSLLTHSSGLDVSSDIGTASRQFDKVISLSEFIRTKQTKSFWAPHKATSYSNYGFGLLGYIVELVSGLPFETYMKENLLDPLEMLNSTFDPKVIRQFEEKEQLAVGYEYFGSLVAAPMNYQFNKPAAGMRASTVDMANFVNMLLQKGRFKGQQILGEEYVEMLTTPQFKNHKGLLGIGYSIREVDLAGQRVWTQNGGWQGFNNDFYLLKAHQLGIATSANANDQEIAERVFEYILEKHFPSSTKKTQLKALPLPKNAKEFVGTYRSNIHAREAITKLGILIGFVGEYEITLANDSLYHDGRPMTYHGDLLFSYRGNTIAFQREGGKIKRMARNNFVYDTYDKVGFFEQVSFHQMLLIVILLLIVIQLLVSLVSVFVKKRKPINEWTADQSRYLKRAKRVLTTFNGLGILFLLVNAYALTAQNFYDFQFGATPMLKLASVLSIALLILLPFVLLMAVLVYRKGFWSKWGRLYYSMMALNGVAFVWFLNFWNLIGFNY